MKQRCSIAWCPWRAKYHFGTIGYRECWFHYEEMPWLNKIWNTLTNPIHFYYTWVLVFVCFGMRGLGWKFTFNQWKDDD